jgi:diguanylate cyclase
MWGIHTLLASAEAMGRRLSVAGSGAPGRHNACENALKKRKRSVAQIRRRELLDAICSFLIDHDLEITLENLARAWSAYSGASPGLLQRIEERLRTGDKITQSWLDEHKSELGEREDRALLLLAELDESIGQFTNNTTAVRSATRDYRSELTRQVLQLEGPGQEHEVVSSLASLARSMVERARLAEAGLKSSEQEARALRRRLKKAKHEAERDALTGLPNRRAFELELARQYAECNAAKEALSIAFCDIDHFKRVNDRHGHAAGDRVLKLIAEVLSHCSNDNCHISRHGGEEFVLLFRGLSCSEAKARLDSARRELAGRRLLNRDTNEPFGQISFSAGVANVFAHGNPRDALTAADAALYRAKEAGRDRVFLADTEAHI